jgi:hypothetical protein
MHFKSYVIDGALLRTVSANWSPIGLKRQDNDMHYEADKTLAALFETRFEAMWDRPTNRMAPPVVGVDPTLLSPGQSVSNLLDSTECCNLGPSQYPANLPPGTAGFRQLDAVTDK